MKLYLLVALLSLFNCFKNKAVEPTAYENFMEFVSKGFKPTETIKKNCEWQYAVVQVNTNAQNKVISYTVLNKPSNEFEKCFQYLIGYHFPGNVPINSHPVVFCLSIENEKLACSTSKMRYSPSQVLGKVFSTMELVFKSDPKAIFIPQILQLAYSFDSIR